MVVIEISLVVLILDLVAAAAGAVELRVAAACAGLVYFVVVFGIVLLWASNGEKGVATWQ